MKEWGSTTAESRKRWEANADYWDAAMGDESNRFHREIVRPATEELLGVKRGDRVLDCACGNGNFSRRLAEAGCRVTAFDFSETLVTRARERCGQYGEAISFHVADATKEAELLSLGCGYDAAVSNMAVMDIAEISPLFRAVYAMLKPEGVFVFSLMHPCFQPPNMRKVTETEEVGRELVTRHSIQIFEYVSPRRFEGIALKGQPAAQLYYHRPLSVLLESCFSAGFVMDAMREPVFAKEESTQFDWYEIPPAVVIRLRKGMKRE